MEPGVVLKVKRRGEGWRTVGRVRRCWHWGGNVLWLTLDERAAVRLRRNVSYAFRLRGPLDHAEDELKNLTFVARLDSQYGDTLDLEIKGELPDWLYDSVSRFVSSAGWLGAKLGDGRVH